MPLTIYTCAIVVQSEKPVGGIEGIKIDDTEKRRIISLIFQVHFSLFLVTNYRINKIELFGYSSDKFVVAIKDIRYFWSIFPKLENKRSLLIIVDFANLAFSGTYSCLTLTSIQTDQPVAQKKDEFSSSQRK